MGDGGGCYGGSHTGGHTRGSHYDGRDGSGHVNADSSIPGRGDGGARRMLGRFPRRPRGRGRFPYNSWASFGMATGCGFGGSISHDWIGKSYGGEAFKGSEDQVGHQSAPLNPLAAATHVFNAPALDRGVDTGAMKPKEHNRTGIIRVERGHISIDNLITKLRRLVPVRFQWDVKETAPDTFMVQFPSVIELDRLHRVGSVPSFDFDVNLVIDKWEQEIEAKFVLKKTWFKVYGVPYEIRGFLSLHAVGSVIGQTTTVDMVYLKKYGVVRMQVVVDDLATLPPSVYIVVQNNGYEIFFEPELPEFDGKGEKKTEEEDHDAEPKNGVDDVEMKDRDIKHQKNDSKDSLGMKIGCSALLRWPQPTPLMLLLTKQFQSHPQVRTILFHQRR
ncbi:hypothetical protein ABZP36_006314 [Zizania latifolia]